MKRDVMEDVKVSIALAIIWRPDLRSETRNEILVQCCEERHFYCLPGGEVRPGENSSEAIHRELKEQYSFFNTYEKTPKELAEQHSFGFAHYGSFMEFEMQPPVRCKYIFHKFMLEEGLRDSSGTERVVFPHNSDSDIKLAWCSVDDLVDKLAYPSSLVRPLVKKLNVEDEGYIYASGFE
jgi:ADP-ribose pyrophosphatase YjhB (NUDIX family)